MCSNNACNNKKVLPADVSPAKSPAAVPPAKSPAPKVTRKRTIDVICDAQPAMTDVASQTISSEFNDTSSESNISSVANLALGKTSEQRGSAQIKSSVAIEPINTTDFTVQTSINSESTGASSSSAVVSGELAERISSEMLSPSTERISLEIVSSDKISVTDVASQAVERMSAVVNTSAEMDIPPETVSSDKILLADIALQTVERRSQAANTSFTCLADIGVQTNSDYSIETMSSTSVRRSKSTSKTSPELLTDDVDLSAKSTTLMVKSFFLDNILRCNNLFSFFSQPEMTADNISINNYQSPLDHLSNERYVLKPSKICITLINVFHDPPHPTSAYVILYIML